MPDNTAPLAPVPQPIDTAPKDGGWILGRVPVDPDKSWQHPWMILTWGDSGWADHEGYDQSPVEWVPLPDPQPASTGWAPPAGTIQIVELSPDGWTMDGKPIPAPYFWMVEIQRPNGERDEYRDCDMAGTIDEARARALKWQEKFSLPIVTVPLDGKVAPFRPAVTKQ